MCLSKSPCFIHGVTTSIRIGIYFFFLKHFITCIYVFVSVWMCWGVCNMRTCQGQSKPFGTWLSPSNVGGPWIPTQISRLGGNPLYPMSHPACLALYYEGYLQFILYCQLPFDFSIIITVLPVGKECKS